jgi:hypothetical protein
MTYDKARATLLDEATWCLLAVLLLVVLALRHDMLGLLLVAWLPIRWGLARVVAACRPAPETTSPATPDRPFGYEGGDDAPR